jgi:hypothetical protein
MSEPIGPGDLVERVRPGTPQNGFRVGAIYCVRNVLRHKRSCRRCAGNCGILLCDAPSPGEIGLPPSNSWCVCGFRPISRRSSFETFLNEIKRPVPALEPDRLGAESV